MKKFLLTNVTTLFAVAMCTALSPDQQARVDAVTNRIIDKALTLGEKKLDKALGLEPDAAK